MGNRDASAAPRTALPVKQLVFTLLVALSLSYGVARTNRHLITGPHFEDRLEVHTSVLARDAFMPYQFHMYLMAHVCQWVHDHVGLTLVNSFYAMYLIGYAVLFVSLWALLLVLYRRTAAILFGLFALMAYALLLLPLSYHHPADPFGAALVALTLLAAMRGSIAGMAFASLAGGFFWSKQILLAPVVLIYEGLRSRWGRGLAIAALIGGLSFIGQLVYHLPPNPTVPEGALPFLDWLRVLPRAALAHIAFAVPPLLSLWLLRDRLHPIVKAAAATYPMMLAVYSVNGFFMYEMRSFWPVVPPFVCLIAAWAVVPDAAEDESAPKAATRAPDEELAARHD